MKRSVVKDSAWRYFVQVGLLMTIALGLLTAFSSQNLRQSGSHKILQPTLLRGADLSLEENRPSSR